MEPRQEDTYYIKTTARTNLYTLNFYLNWKRTFGSHNLGMMLGTQYSMKEYDYFATKALNILPSLILIPEVLSLLSPPNSQRQLGVAQLPHA